MKNGIFKMEGGTQKYINTTDNEINEYYRNSSVEVNNLMSVIYEFVFEGSVVGYVTASMSKLYTIVEGRQTNYPSILLGQLGVDQNYLGQGFGTQLVYYIIGLGNLLKEEIGCRLIILEVENIVDHSEKLIENEQLIQWYISLGFEKSEIQGKKKSTFLFFNLKNQ